MKLVLYLLEFLNFRTSNDSIVVLKDRVQHSSKTQGLGVYIEAKRYPNIIHSLQRGE